MNRAFKFVLFVVALLLCALVVLGDLRYKDVLAIYWLGVAAYWLTNSIYD